MNNESENENEDKYKESAYNYFDNKIRVSKECPECKWRVLDKVTPTTGIIAIKCPRCRRVVLIDLSFRRVI